MSNLKKVFQKKNATNPQRHLHRLLFLDGVQLKMFLISVATVLNLLLIEQIFGKLLPINQVDGRDVGEMARCVRHFNAEVFLGQTSQVAVVKSVESSAANGYFSELLSEILKPWNDMKIRLSDVGVDYRHEYDYFNILLIDSYRSFE